MKIVIDIPENIYEWAKKPNMPDDIFDEVVEALLDAAFSNSTPLPKGHGRLIDADEVKRKMGNLDGFGMIGRCIDEFPTIVEADKEESEDNALEVTE